MKNLILQSLRPHIEPLRSKQLVAASRSGSAAAFAELREIYAQRVYRKLLTITNNREDAEDALQDTFLRAYKAVHAFEERASFYTWVTRIAINSALMILRKRRIRSEVSFDRPRETEEDFSYFELKDTGPTPEHICVHRQRYAHMLRSIRKLQPRLRQVIEMQMMDNCSARRSLRHFIYPKPPRNPGSPGRARAWSRRGRQKLAMRCTRSE